MAFDSNKYRQNFQKENYDRIGVYLPKGTKSKLEQAAKAQNKSVNKFITDCVLSAISQDQQTPTATASGNNDSLLADRHKQLSEMAKNFDYSSMLEDQEDEAPIDRPHDEIDSMLDGVNGLFSVDEYELSRQAQFDKFIAEQKERAKQSLGFEEDEDEPLPF